MKLSSISKLTAASLVAGMAFAFAGTPADAQAIPSRTAVIDSQSNVTEVQYRTRRHVRSPRHFRTHRPFRRSHRHSHRRGFHGPSFGIGIGLGLAAPLLAAPFTAPRTYGYAAAPSYGTGGMTPGSSAWIQYCSQKYNSFDPASGTYLAYSGVRRPCQVP